MKYIIKKITKMKWKVIDSKVDDILRNGKSNELKSKQLEKILRDLSNSFPIKNYRRNVLLVSQGIFTDKKRIFNKIWSKLSNNRCKLYSISINCNSVQELFLKNLSRILNGKSISLKAGLDQKNMIDNLLEELLSPSLTRFKITFDPKYVSAIAPIPWEDSHLTRNDPFQLYVLLNNDLASKSDKITTVKVEYFDSASKVIEKRNFELVITDTCVIDNTTHKFCIKYLLDAISSPIFNHYLHEELEQIPGIETQLSIAYQVLHPGYSSFYCLVHNKDQICKRTKINNFNWSKYSNSLSWIENSPSEESGNYNQCTIKNEDSTQQESDDDDNGEYEIFDLKECEVSPAVSDGRMKKLVKDNIIGKKLVKSNDNSIAKKTKENPCQKSNSRSGQGKKEKDILQRNQIRNMMIFERFDTQQNSSFMNKLDGHNDSELGSFEFDKDELNTYQEIIEQEDAENCGVLNDNIDIMINSD